LTTPRDRRSAAAPAREGIVDESTPRGTPVDDDGPVAE